MESPAVSNDNKKQTPTVWVNDLKPTNKSAFKFTRKKIAALVATLGLGIALACIIVFVVLEPNGREGGPPLPYPEGPDPGGCTPEGTSMDMPDFNCTCWTKDMWTCTLPDESTALLTLGLPSNDECTLVTFETDAYFEDSKWECDGNSTLVSPPVDVDNIFLTWYWPSHYEVPVGTSCLRREELDEDICRGPDREVPGRPLYDKFGNTLLAGLVSVALQSSGNDWLAPVVDTETTPRLNVTTDEVSVESCDESQALSSDERGRLVRMWEQAARYEHASVASFSKFSLQLMAVGAPPALVLGAHVAAIEEIGHAKLSFQAAQAIARTAGTEPSARQSIGQLPVPSLEISSTTSELAYSTAIEGAVGETFAAFAAAVAHHDTLITLQATRDDNVTVALTQVVDALATIMKEEGSHAALAWRTLDWAIDHPVDGETREQVMHAVERAFKEQRVEVERKFHAYGQVTDVNNEPVVGWGHMGTHRRSKLDHAVFNEVTEVLLSALIDRTMKDHSFVSGLLHEEGGDSAMQVLDHISDLLKQDD